MIIKSHIYGDYRSAAKYLQAQGENEQTRTVEISDVDASNLDEAFRNMWAIARNSKVIKALHHISINPFKDERLTDQQVCSILKCCEDKYGYKTNEHQRVVVEHVKKGRQHFHVMWNRVSLKNGRPIWPGHHWRKSKQISREMEIKLGLKKTLSRRIIRVRNAIVRERRIYKTLGRYEDLNKTQSSISDKLISSTTTSKVALRYLFRLTAWKITRKNKKICLSDLQIHGVPFRGAGTENQELLIWAYKNKRLDIIAQFGIILPENYKF